MSKQTIYNAGIYVRLSQEDMRAGESLSIENQKLILTKYVKEQGWNLVDLSGKRVGETIDGLHVFSLDEIGYGTITGFKGVNCGHDWFAYIEGISTPNYTQEQLEEMNARNIEYNGKMYTQYEINQMQRAGEQKVRMLKRRCVLQEEALRNATDPETKAVLQQKYQSTAAKLKDTEQQLKTFCKDTGNNRDRFREQVYGFGRSQAQKAIWAEKKYENSLTSASGSGTINEIEMFRKKTYIQRPDVKPVRDEVFRGITVQAKKKGANLIRCKYGDEMFLHLEKNNANAACIGDTLIFRPDATISEVLEETYHFEQNLSNLNSDKEPKLRIILNEIDAKEYLLKNSKRYSIPRKEIEETQEHLRKYQEDLKKYNSGE